MLPQIQKNLLIQNKAEQMDIPRAELFHLSSEGSAAEVLSALLFLNSLPTLLCTLSNLHLADRARKAQLFAEPLERHSPPRVLSTSA